MSYHKILINMEEFADIVDAQGTFCPKSIVEIGSMDGADAEYLARRYYKAKTVFILEAHPDFARKIRMRCPDYTIVHAAGSDNNGFKTFNCVDVCLHNAGISSVLENLKPWAFHREVVPTVRMDTFMEGNKLKDIDLLKIDVEGYSFEVLEGFGDRLKDVRAIHIENEYIECWKGQKLYSQVEKLLLDQGFILVAIKAAWPQSDSVWVQGKWFNSSWWKWQVLHSERRWSKW